MSSSRLRKYNSRNSFFIPESECHFFILFPSVSEPSKLSFDGVWWWIYQANKSVTQAETYLSGHFSETKVAPQEITTSSRPLLFWIVYLMTSFPVSVLPKTSWLTTMFLVGLLWSFCTGDDRLTTAREQWVTRPRNKRQLWKFPHVHLHDLLQTELNSIASPSWKICKILRFSMNYVAP